MALKGHAKRRAYGQHFLIDQNVISRTIEAVQQQLAVHPTTRAVLEIGPGAGALTRPFIEFLQTLPESTRPAFRAAEMDRDFASEWASRGVGMLTGDFLDQRPELWLDQTPLLVFSNLPYSSGTAILTRLADYPERIPAMVLMFQTEVANRIAAEPDTRAWGSLSLWIQNRWDVTIVCDAPPRAFKPAPKVNSQVICLQARVAPRLSGTQTQAGLAAFQSLIHQAFRQRRKMLRGLFPVGTPERKAFDEANLDGTQRAESLGWQEWDRWLNALLGSSV